MDDESNVTWPRSQISPMHDLKRNIQKNLGSLRKISEHIGDEDSKSVINNLYNNNSQTINKLAAQSAGNTPYLTTSSSFIKNFRRNRLYHQPHFGSMVICAKPEKPSLHSSKKSIQYVNGTDGMIIEQMVDDKIDDEIDKIPFYAKFISSSILFFIFTVYVIAGTYVIRSFDPALKNGTFAEVTLIPYQLITTIGWGNQAVVDHRAQIFCIVYGVFGIPLCITVMSQMGKWFFEGFTSDWIYNTAVLRHTPGTSAPIIRFPVIKAFNGIIGHLLIGVILFNEIFKHFEIVESLYFTYIAIALTGFGDLAPHPTHMYETFIFCIYFMFGATLTAVIHVAFSYHIQRIFFIHFKDWLYDKYTTKVLRDKIAPKKIIQNNNNNHHDSS